MAANDDTASMPFIKHLASSDRKVRDSALSTLRAFLSGAGGPQRRLGPTDNLKLWKGLFYSLWMCDRPLPQQNLCAELAALARALPDAAAVAPWHEAFWATVSREWTTGIDVLRMEKFLLLVRRVLAASMEWAVEGKGGEGDRKKKNKNKNKNKSNGNKRSKSRDSGNDNEEEEEVVVEGLDQAEEMLAVFAAWPLERTGDLAKVPVGLRLHVLDIWVDEAEKLGLWPEDDEAGGEPDEEKKREFLNRIRELVEVQTKSACKPVRVRAKESLADERLPWNKSGESGEDEDVEMSGNAHGDKDSWDGFED